MKMTNLTIVWLLEGSGFGDNFKEVLKVIMLGASKIAIWFIKWWFWCTCLYQKSFFFIAFEFGWRLKMLISTLTSNFFTLGWKSFSCQERYIWKDGRDNWDPLMTELQRWDKFRGGYWLLLIFFNCWIWRLRHKCTGRALLFLQISWLLAKT